MIVTERVTSHWYQPRLTLLMRVFLPLAWVFAGVVKCRRWLYQTGLLPKVRFPVPVIVVGNLTVGGTGKTPMVIWLAEKLRQQGYRPGIVTRGVGGGKHATVLQAVPDSDPCVVGDEAVLLARRTDCPVMIAVDRVKAVQALLDRTDCNIVISDDGLQHYRLGRSCEIILVDGARQLGNGVMLPAGPLRETPARLREANAVFFKGQDFVLSGSTLVALENPAKTRPLTHFSGQTVHAVAGISHPENFFASLRAEGMTVIPHVFPDHYAFCRKDITFADGFPVVMTEKDAVKCHSLAGRMHWYLPVSVCPGENMLTKVEEMAWSS